ncbi:hypothetical protein C8R43DRAFT_1238245 [Mycena crocata]|nr:hypothetical protein C8R43DRAFT_1238245 [Mycena crocata]
MTDHLSVRSLQALFRIARGRTPGSPVAVLPCGLVSKKLIVYPCHRKWAGGFLRTAFDKHHGRNLALAMSTPPIPFPIFNGLLAQTYGVFLAAVFVSCGLFGVVALQVFIYYMKKNKDPTLLRALPAFLIVMEFVHQVLLCVGAYKIVINNFGNEGVATLIVPELFVASFFQAFCATSAHLFYTYRIWKFRKGLWIVPCLTIPLTMTQFGFTYANNALALIHNDVAYLQTITYTVYATHGVNVFLDLFFVIAMVILLSKEQDVFTQTRTMIRRLTMLVINTGLITTVATLLTIIFVGVQPATFTYVFFNSLVSPLYGNSVMANLNSRDYVRGRRDHVTGTASLELNAWNINNNTSRPTLPTTQGADTKVGDGKGLEGVTVSQDTIIRKDNHVASVYPMAYKSTGDV